MLKRFAKGLRYYRRHALQVTACKTVVGLRVSCPPDRAWYNSRSHPHLQKFTPRRGAGVAEQGCLLSSYPGKTGIGGSNPPLSAINKYTQIQPGLREIALSVVTSKLGMSRRMLTTFDPKIVRIFSRAYSEN